MIKENTNSSSSSKRISLASFNNQEITRKDKLSTCCNVKRYQIRRVKNKGAVLVLVISYLVTSINLFSCKHYRSQTSISGLAYSIWYYHSHIRMAD